MELHGSSLSPLGHIELKPSSPNCKTENYGDAFVNLRWTLVCYVQHQILAYKIANWPTEFHQV